MRIFLQPPVTVSDIKNATNLLLGAGVVAQGSAVVREGERITSGVIVLLRDRDAGEAIEILSKAGIRAQI